MAEQKQIRVQQLEENNFHEGQLYQLKQGWILHLKLSNKLINRQYKVFSNLPPANKNQKFDRKTFYEYEFLSQNQKDDFCKYVHIECHTPGAYRYYFTPENNPSQIVGSCDFLIDPELYLPNNQKIDLNGLQMQTVLTKLLGPLDEWKSRLELAKQSGYNIIHFTPIQDLSHESHSSYSIRDHLTLMHSANSNNKFNLNDVKNVIASLYNEWHILSLCDLVYNHMANDSEFLIKSPDSAFNLKNSPHLRPAFVLDRIFYHFTVDIANGKYESQGIVKGVIREDQLELLRHILSEHLIPKYKINEFFTFDLNEIMTRIDSVALDSTKIDQNSTLDNLVLIQDPHFRRLKSSVDLKLAKFLTQKFGTDAVRSKLITLLNQHNEKIESYMTESVNNVISTVYYFFFDKSGPRWDKVSRDQPIVRTYFYYPFADESVEADEKRGFEDLVSSMRIQAHNGWVMGDDPLRNFAAPDSTVYLRRQLIPWGDSVKLRYGEKPEDSPELWAYMSDYTRITASIFHGVRLDNCHSTPIHVAQYFLDLARQIRPNLYVIAELFTNSESIDNKFVKELGITSLIRESMNAWNANELGRLVHRFSGEPVGSFVQPACRPLIENLPHAIFYDQTHDNQPLIKSHSVYDALPTSCLICMTKSAVGSVRGFDELVPHYIDVVNETRRYKKWSNENDAQNLSDIWKAKKIINDLHFETAAKGFTQTYLDQFDADTTVITRHNPSSLESIILIARTAFSEPNGHTSQNLGKPVFIPGKIEQV
jgi:glycogen debranching enzyme